MSAEPEAHLGKVVVDPGDGPLYVPHPAERQLTVRAVLAGCLIGGAVSTMNIYFGLKTGWSIGGSLIAAILSFSLFYGLRVVFPRIHPFSPLETNIAQTSGSAAGSMTSAAGLLNAIPAMGMLGYTLTYLELTIWAAAVATLGIFYAIPLRRQFVLVDKLRFPTGTATAETILAMFSSGADAVKKARYLLGFGAFAGLFTLGTHWFPWLSFPPLETSVFAALFAGPAAYGFKLYVSPLMAGAGILIGFRVGISLLIGAVLSWGFLAPMVEDLGWVTGPTMSYADGARGWILWPGVAWMASDALTSLALSWRSMVNTFKGGGGEGVDVDNTDTIPNTWWMGGLAGATVLTIVAVWWVFQIPPWMTVLAVALSSVLAAIAVRSTGETDINPIGGMGKVTQLVYGGLAPGQASTNLMTAAITSAGASQAGDMMQDLKTGHLLGASPRNQVVAQLFGVCVGVAVCVPVYLLFDSVYTLGEGDVFPAPAAHAWKAMAEVLTHGVESLPHNAGWAAVYAAGFGTVIPVMRKLLGWDWLPSGLAIGIAFIVPAFYSVAMFLGAYGLFVWKRSQPVEANALGFAVASGLIAGEGLMGVVNALLEFFGL